MEIKVAIIGPYDFLGEILRIAATFSDVTWIPLGYKNVQDAKRLVLQCKEEADVFLFAGPIPYQIAREHVVEPKPMVYLPYNGTSLYRVFFQIMREGGMLHEDYRLRFSIDVLNKQEVEQRLEELSIRVDQMYALEYQLEQSTDDILRFHHDLWTSGKVDAILTCVASVYEELTRLGIPCYRIIPTKSTIQECLHQTQLEWKNLQLSDNQIAVGIINVESMLKKWGSSEYELQRKKIAIQEILIDYGEEMQALMNWPDRNEVIFVTTRGVIERTTNMYTRFPLLEKIVNRLNIAVSIGIGLGRTANEAQSKAGDALAKAKARGGSCFIAMHDGSVFGPLGKDYHLAYSLRSNNPERLDAARKSGLSIGTINKLISFCQNYGSSQVTASDLANRFDVSLRSARRILSKLEQSQLAMVVGEEQPLTKGRPRQIFDLRLHL
ncbi:transcriptional regulator [Brevibacillus choshinensis]|uniref:transcriptional regulator n=1 Tax=Brevibacillus choshinensis TaxID=54911 RepID=UPI002E1CB6AA|nr:transcriptional regulator [Brevibacillus choshinensis]